MQTHPFFTDLLLHTDDELADLLKISIVERQTIHEWPLSCVQRLLLADGTRRIYKSQLPPTVEPHFYQAASSPLLPAYRLLGKLGQCEVMFLDWIDAPLLRDAATSEADLVEHGRRVINQIAEIKGDLPAYVDIGSREKWQSVGQGMFEKLSTLLQDKRFVSVSSRQVEQVRRWADTAEVLTKVSQNPRLTHGDLTAEQVFVAADGYRVIDWQRPVIAPPEIDLVALLAGQGVDPRPHVNKFVIGIYWFLHLRWAVEAQFDLFPARRLPLFDQWASEAVHHILSDAKR